MSSENPLWGAPRIHGELMMLGIKISRLEGLPAQPCRKHRVHPLVRGSISFKLLYGLVILGHLRTRLIRESGTTNPTAEWIAGQVTEAFPWDEHRAICPRPRRLIRSDIHSPHPGDGIAETADLWAALRIRAPGLRTAGTLLPLVLAEGTWVHVHSVICTNPC